MIIQTASVLLLVCLSLKVNNDHLNFPSKSDPGSITHYRPLCSINSCTDLVSARMHLDKLRHSHLAPPHTKTIHSMQLVRIIHCSDVSSNPGPAPVHPCGVCNRAVTNKCPAIQCDYCNTWIHITCSGITNSRYDTYIASPDHTFICPQCNMPTFLQNFSSTQSLQKPGNLRQIANKLRVMSVNCNSIQSLDKCSELSAF